MPMRALIISLILAVDLALPGAARSQTNVTLVPSVSVSAVSDDNIFTTETRSADQTTLVSPGLEGSVETPRGSLLGSYSFDMLRSAYFAALNNLEARRHGMFDGHFRQTPQLTLALNGHYDRSDNSGELNFETGFLLERRRAQRWQLTPSFAYQTSPTVTIRGQYDWVREALEQTIVANEHVARFGVWRQLSTRTSISAGYLGRYFVNGAETERSSTALFGWAREMDPFTILSLQAGPRLSSRGQLAPEIVASLARRAPDLIGYAFDYWRGESIILGVLGPVEIQSATGKFIWPIRHTVDLTTAAGTYHSASLTQGESRIYHGEIVVSWSPKPFYAIAASYGADFQRGDLQTLLFANRGDVVRHVFLVKLTVAPRLSHAIQPTQPVEPLGPPTKGVKQ
jgi:hypothetical protein